MREKYKAFNINNNVKFKINPVMEKRYLRLLERRLQQQGNARQFIQQRR